jgi:DNA-directed RNA polymerase specialized sigma24 family protein
MSEKTLPKLSSGIVREIAAGSSEAFDRLLRQYNSLLVQRASFYLRRIRVLDTFYEGQEAVDDALAAMCDRARRGELVTVQSSADFWREFFYQIRREIRKTRDYNKAQGRNPNVRANGSSPHRRRDTRCAKESPMDANPSWLESKLEEYYYGLSSHEALVAVEIDVELLYMSFSDPICREILKMRLEGYSVEEIARHCNLSTRTVERRLQDIRLHYSTFLGP